MRESGGLAAGRVEVWEAWAGDAALRAGCWKLLTREERARAERTREGWAREEFVVGRGCLRALLGAVLGRPGSEVAIGVGTHGKPWVEGVSFNVAHSRGEVLIALSGEGAVGVDVEWLDPGIEAMEIAQGAFAPGEVAAIAAADDRVGAFYRCWTRKEAVVKAHGQGLTLDLKGFVIETEGPGECEVKLPAVGGTYFVRGLGMRSGYVGALAVENGDQTVDMHKFQGILPLHSGGRGVE